MNELNRSMGLSDAYPFDLSPAVRGKLHFVHMAILNFRKVAQARAECEEARFRERAFSQPQSCMCGSDLKTLSDRVT
jgi:Putative zinc-binding metallo-peptidase